MDIKDLRIKLMNEILNGIKVSLASNVSMNKFYFLLNLHLQIQNTNTKIHTILFTTRSCIIERNTLYQCK